jgi:putative ABC transport system permease protein
MWYLAIKAFFADRAKVATVLLGVAFSVILINLQGGLLVGLIRKAALLVDNGQADVWIGRKFMNNVETGDNLIPERWINRVRSVPGVERASPYLVMFSNFGMPDGRRETVVVVGCDPATMLGGAWKMAEGNASDIRHPDGILVDVCDVEKLGNCKIGDVREINHHRAQVVGLTHGIVSFTTSPYVFTTLDRARDKYLPAVPPGQCSYFLVKAEPGTDVPALVERLRARVPELDVYERREYAWRSMEYWLTRTGLGISFGLAALLGLLVGLAVVAQTFYASVTERLKEFATLKALGATDGSVGQFLLSQACGSAVLGSVIGLVGSVVVSGLISSPRAPVVLTWEVAALSVALVSVVCVASAYFPYWRIRKIDPASVLRS